jgi:aminopeptidase YwaD
LGRLGNAAYFPGANDNASGVSMLLNLAKTIKLNPLKYNVVFILFAGEEAGLLGSHYFVDHPIFPLNKIKFLVNLDLNGTGDDGATVVNSTIYTSAFDKLKKINDDQRLLSQLKTRGKAANSDHYWFTEKGVPAFFIYTMGGISAYHDIYDRPETLPLTKYKELHQLLLNFMQQL